MYSYEMYLDSAKKIRQEVLACCLSTGVAMSCKNSNGFGYSTIPKINSGILLVSTEGNIPWEMWTPYGIFLIGLATTDTTVSQISSVMEILTQKFELLDVTDLVPFERADTNFYSVNSIEVPVFSCLTKEPYTVNC